MHEHDLDLIAALADGSLADETEARALVDACDVCRSEYRSQMDVVAWVASAPHVEMTELEKAALHRDLWTELRRDPARAAPIPWWQRWSYVAAGLFVVVGLAGVLNGVMGSGDSGGETQESRLDLDAAQGSDEAAPFLAEDSGSGGGAESGATTTAAAEQAASVPFPELADEVRASRETNPSMGTMSPDATVDECLDRVGLDDHIVVAELELDQVYLAVMAEDQGPDRSVTFITPADCEIVFVDR
jgi:hypothetical protein